MSPNRALQINRINNTSRINNGLINLCKLGSRLIWINNGLIADKWDLYHCLLICINPINPLLILLILLIPLIFIINPGFPASWNRAQAIKHSRLTNCRKYSVACQTHPALVKRCHVVQEFCQFQLTSLFKCVKQEYQVNRAQVRA